MKTELRTLSMWLFVCALATTANAAAVVMPDVFSDNMILQRDRAIPVWGQGKDGTEVTVTFAGKTLKTKAKEGRWAVTLPAMKANSKPGSMTVSSSDGFKKTITNIVIGDVWLASGQSNMTMGLGAAKGGKEAIAKSENPMLRLFQVDRKLEKQDPPLGTTWHESNPRSSAKQSAVGYFFVSELQKTLGIPVGLIHCSYGGTPTETWCSPEVMAKGWPAWDARLKLYLKNPKHPKRRTASVLYNRMLKTVMPFAVKGFIWYQGEANAGRAEEQKKLFPAMVADWRKSWGDSKLPFYIVQLARYEGSDWHAFRCAQLDVWKNVPNSYMAVTIDLSKEPGNHPIHPKVKAPIGHRLALAARANVYGETDLVYSGPIISGVKVKDNAAILSFDHIGSGLAVSDGKPLRGFYLSGDGKTFVAGTARITGKTVTVTSEKVKTPVAVRYGAEADMGKKTLDVNLMNKEKLPASPFTINVTTPAETQ